MKNTAFLKVVQGLEITRIYPTCLVEMIEKKNYRTKESFDKASKSVLGSWKVGSRMYLRDHFIHHACLTEKTSPQQSRDSPKVLRFWLVTNSEPDLDNPAPFQ